MPNSYYKILRENIDPITPNEKNKTMRGTTQSRAMHFIIACLTHNSTSPNASFKPPKCQL